MPINVCHRCTTHSCDSETLTHTHSLRLWLIVRSHYVTVIKMYRLCTMFLHTSLTSNLIMKKLFHLRKTYVSVIRISFFSNEWLLLMVANNCAWCSSLKFAYQKLNANIAHPYGNFTIEFLVIKSLHSDMTHNYWWSLIKTILFEK